MIKHIVMMRLKEVGADEKQEQLQIIKLKLDSLLGIVPSLKTMEVGLNFSTRETAFDLVLVSTFADENALKAYAIHPEHVKVLDYLKDKLAATAVTDYFF
ncbi:MAG: Dabb family protein [Bacteroidales bacterium]|nr:Dabb family protein [Bacteroidales bacterium]